MDAAETFRYFLNNRTIPDTGVSANEFVFKTVFYKCGPSYCICRCAYDHEILSYVSDNGDVDMETLDTLTAAIKDGYCPHASKFTDKSYLRPTGINIFHIAAALDSEELSRTFIYGYHSGEIDIRNLYSKIFKKHPFHISVLKGNAVVAALFAKNNLHSAPGQWGNRIILANERQSNVLRAEQTSLHELCIAKRDIQMMDLLFKCADPAHYLSSGERVYELLFKNNLVDMLNAILDDIMTENEEWRSCLGADPYHDPDYSRRYDLVVDVLSMVKLAVMYNQRDIFDKSLQLLSKGRTSSDGNPLLTVRNEEGHPLIMVCEAFKWGNSHKSYSQKELKNLKGAKTVSNFVYLYGLLTHYTSSGLQIKHAMKQLPDISELINAPFDATFTKYETYEGLTPLQSYISKHGQVSMEVVRTLVELGADIDTLYPQDLKKYNKSIRSTVTLKGGQPLVLHLCILNEDDKNSKREWRKILELLLYENVSLDINKTVVGFGLKHYKDLLLYKLRMQVGTTNTMKNSEQIEPGTYIMDAEIHESVLDFAVPLLMEAGFNYTRADIEEAINLPIAPSDDSEDDFLDRQHCGIGSEGPLPLEKNHVLEYLGQCLSGTRPLMFLCRNVLRKCFPRRQIHRCVSSVKLPQTIKDYLLLKPLLLTLSDDI